MAKHPSAIANGMDDENPPPGLTSVASATGDTGLDERPRRSKPAKLEIEGRCRQQRRGDVGACHRRDAIVGHEDEVIGGARADRGCDKRAAARAELVGVDARLQARGAACLAGCAAIPPA